MPITRMVRVSDNRAEVKQQLLELSVIFIAGGAPPVGRFQPSSNVTVHNFCLLLLR